MLTKRKNWIKPTVILIIFTGIYAVIGFALAPHFLKQAMVRQFAEKLDAVVDIDKLRINPFSLSIEIDGLRLAHAGDEPILSVAYIYGDLKLYSLLARSLLIDELIIELAEVDLTLHANGQTNYSWLTGRSSKADRPVLFEIDNFDLRSGTLRVSDSREGPALVQELSNIEIQMMNFGTYEASHSEYMLSMHIGDNGRAEIAGQINLSELTSTGSFEMSELELLEFADWIPLDRDLQIAGKLSLQSNYSLVESDGKWLLEIKRAQMQIVEHQLQAIEPLLLEIDSFDLKFAAMLRLSDAAIGGRLTGMDFELVNLRVSDVAADRKLFAIDKLTVSQAQLDSTKKELSLAEIKVTGSEIFLIRTDEGELDWANYISRIGIPGSAAAETEQLTANSWTMNLESANFEDVDLYFTDKTTKLVNTQTINDISVSFSGLTNKPGEQSPFEIQARVNNAGMAKAGGWVNLRQKSAELDIDLEEIALAPFNPYLHELSYLQLTGGSLSLQAQITALQDQLDSNANLAVKQLSLAHAGDGREVISSTRISVSDIVLKAFPLGASIKLIEIGEPHMEIGIDAQGHLNLSQWFMPADVNERKSAGINPEPQIESGALIISRIKIVEGAVSFTDASLTPQLQTNLRALNGDIVGLRPGAKGTPAALQLDGQVGEYGQVNIKGLLTLFDPAQQSEVEMLLQNLDTTVLSPYSGRFAGRAISSGKLDLDLQYRISEGTIKGENSILLKDLVLGEQVESRDALDLPLDMAIALLQDKNGKIDISIPVSGDLNNPKFDIRALIGKAVSNMISGIVSAPFKALAGIFGGKEKSLDQLPFAPGRADISPPAAEILDSLGKVLIERPALAVQIETGFSPVLDAEAIAENLLRQRVLLASGASLENATSASPMTFTDPGTQQAIESIAASELSEQEISQIRSASFVPDSTVSDKGENPVADSSPYYRTLYSKLRQTVNVSSEELLALSEDRGRRLESQLLEQGIAGERISLISVGAMKDTKDKKISLQLKIIPYRKKHE